MNIRLPTFDPILHFRGLVPDPNTQARSIAETAVTTQLRDFIFPNETDSEIVNGASIQMIFQLTGINPPLYCARLERPTASDWYRSVTPWEFSIHDIVTQRGEVTIMHNVLNPNNAERATLHYVMDKAGKVTITVFNLAGDIVNVLFSGTQSAGEHSTAWDGKNRGGRAVARGIYFIRAVGPGFDEIRKVLVVK